MSWNIKGASLEWALGLGSDRKYLTCAADQRILERNSGWIKGHMPGDLGAGHKPAGRLSPGGLLLCLGTLPPSPVCLGDPLPPPPPPQRSQKAAQPWDDLPAQSRMLHWPHST